MTTKVSDIWQTAVPVVFAAAWWCVPAAARSDSVVWEEFQVADDLWHMDVVPPYLYLRGVHRVECRSLSSGEVVWEFQAASENMTHRVPLEVMKCGAVTFVVADHGDGAIYALDSKTGKTIRSWRFPRTRIDGFRREGTLALFSLVSGAERGGVLVAIDFQDIDNLRLENPLSEAQASALYGKRFAFGSTLYEIAGNVRDGSVAKPILLDSEGDVVRIWELFGPEGGYLVSSEKRLESLMPDLSYPVRSLSRWSADTRFQYWTYRSHLYRVESYGLGRTSEVFVWREFAWVRSSELYRLDAPGGLPVRVQNFDRIVPAQDGVFAVEFGRAHAGGGDQVFWSEDGLSFTRLGTVRNVHDLWNSARYATDGRQLFRMVPYRQGSDTFSVVQKISFDGRGD